MAMLHHLVLQVTSHALNISAVLLTQDLFVQNHLYRTISKNSMYIVIFKVCPLLSSTFAPASISTLSRLHISESEGPKHNREVCHAV